MIDGVNIREIEVKSDLRGSFREVFSDRWGLPIAPRQWSLVRSVAGALRGMHFHLRHDEYLLPISGHCHIGLYDLRPQSATFGRSEMIELHAERPQCVTFPRGVVHGWYFPVETLHLQAVSEPYSEYGEDDNFGCRFDDPELGLAWPQAPTTVTEEARRFPSLAELRRRVLAG